MFIQEQWYLLEWPAAPNASPIDQLDVSLLKPVAKQRRQPQAAAADHLLPLAVTVPQVSAPLPALALEPA